MRRTLRVSRRHFMPIALVGTRAITGWGAPPVAARSRQAPWQTGDVLRLAGSVSGPASLDPALSRDLPTNFLLRQLFRGLMHLDMSLSPQPCLAESIDISTDGLRYTFVLRASARFHDGRQVTAEDVLFSLSRALNPAIAGGHADGLAAVTYLQDIVGAADVLAGTSDMLAGIEVTGERDLVITLQQRSPTFPMKLASVPASIVDMHQVNAGERWLDSPNGSGPFAVTSWQPGESIEFRATETWWNGTPAVDAVTVRLGAAASQPFNLFQDEAIDILADVPVDLVDLVRDPASAVAYGSLLSANLFSTSYIAFGNLVPPLDDLHVRRALQLVFPARQIAEATFGGAMTPATGLIPPGMLDQPWSVAQPETNVDAARAELARSRYGSADSVPPIAIHAADIAPIEALRDVAHRDLGLRVEAIHVNWRDFLDGLARKVFPAYGLYWGADYPDPESMIEMLFGSGSPDNYTGYSNPELDLLLETARAGEGNTRIDAFSGANQLLVDDAAIIPLYHAVGYTLVREGIGDLDVTPMGILGLETVRARS